MKNNSPVKNTDPKTLDRSNIGDAAVLVLDNGNTQSCHITDFMPRIGVVPAAARFIWKTGPGRFDVMTKWVGSAQWADRVTLFPAGCKFLSV